MICCCQIELPWVMKAELGKNKRRMITRRKDCGSCLKENSRWKSFTPDSLPCWLLIPVELVTEDSVFDLANGDILAFTSVTYIRWVTGQFRAKCKSPQSQQIDGGFPSWGCLRLFFCGNLSTLRTQTYPSLRFWVMAVSLMMVSFRHIPHQDLVEIFLAFFDEFQDSSLNISVKCS